MKEKEGNLNINVRVSESQRPAIFSIASVTRNGRKYGICLGGQGIGITSPEKETVYLDITEGVDHAIKILDKKKSSVLRPFQ
jgi:hypothetical protein